MNFEIPLLRKFMRITLLVSVTMIAASQLLWAGKSNGQLLGRKVDLSAAQTNLYEVLTNIQKVHHIDFAFTDRLKLDQIKLNGVNFSKATLADVLTTILVPHRIAFEEKAGTIVLYRMADPGIITGKVLDDKGEPMVGATVRVVELNSNVSVNTDGSFRLSVPPGTYTLEVSYVSFVKQSQKITVSEAKTVAVDFTMKEEAGKLNEVVVVGYGTQKRGEVTSAVATVNAEDFNRGGIRSPLELIQGKVAGLNITKTQGNNPNAGASIQLRGVTSLTGSLTPLIVIDGIPGGNLDLLQQDDIESINVLKDGSAAAIYGTRGNAGVILITTKKGKSGSPTYGYNTYFQRDYVDKKPDFLSADQFRQKIAEGIISQTSNLGGSTDMYDELINKNNLSQYHNFSAAGGTDKTNYRASLYYNDFQGIAKENSREQFGGRVNINQTGMQDRLQLQVNLVANFNQANLLGGGTGDFEQAVAWNPTAPIYKPDGSFYQIQEYYNPFARLNTRESTRDQQTFSGDARLSVKATDDLSVAVFGSYLRNNFNDRNFRSMNDWDQRVGTTWQGFGYAGKSNNVSWTKTFEPTISFEHRYDKHSVTAVGGYSYQYSTSESFNVNNNGFTTDAFLDWNLGSGSAITNTALPRPGMGSFKDDNTLIAFFGRVNYAFNDKYFAQVSLRREGSSRFGANNKWGNFPAASVGWTLSQEDFLKNVKWVNSLRMRLGYGVTGNQGIPNYQSLITLSTGGVYPQNGIYYQTYGASRNPNPNLRWEKKAEWNLGVDYSFFNNRLSGAIDLYSRDTKDLLYNYAAQQPAFVRDGIYTNVGTISNQGIEILISGVPVKNKNFQWNIDLTGSYQENKLSKLSNDLYKATFLQFADIPNPGAMGPAIRLEEGGQVGNFYGKRFAGFAPNGTWLFYKADGTTAPAAQINENDRTIIGNGVPKYNLGISQTFVYKNFDLTVLLRGKFGFDILNLQEIFFGNRNYLPNNIYNSVFDKHEALRDVPQYSDYYLEKGDFVKLDNVTLGYNLKLKNPYLRTARFFVSGRNIATITGYSGLDPELEDTGFTTGVDSRGFYPRTTSWTIGLNLGF